MVKVSEFYERFRSYINSGPQCQSRLSHVPPERVYVHKYRVDSRLVAQYQYPQGPIRDVLSLWHALSVATGIPAYCDAAACHGAAQGSYDLMTPFNAWIDQNRQAIDQVEKLYLKNFSKFCPQMFQLNQLKELHIWDGDFTELPSEICSLPNLRKLHIVSCSNLTALPPEIGRLTRLEELQVDSRITTLPPEIGNLRNLKSLRVRGLTTVPPEIGQLDLLEELSLTFGTLSSLPSEIGQMTNLRKLEVGDNRLTALPAEIGNLSKLKKATFSCNQLTAIPDSLAYLNAHCELYFDSNPLSYEVMQTFGMQIAAVHEEDVNLGPQEGSLFGNIRRLAAERAEAARIQEDIEINRTINAILANVQAVSARSQAPSREDSLEDTILFWLTQFKETFPEANRNQADRFPAHAGDRACLAFYSSLLTHEEKGKLDEFLNRVKGTEDYKRGGASRQKVILDAVSMLQEAATQEKFREALFPILDDATSTCGDRVTLARNTINMQMCLSRADERSDDELAELLIGLNRVELLDGYAKGRIEALNLGDAIETYLFYQVKLKEMLNLPVAADGMLHAGASGITPAMLEEDAMKVLSRTTSSSDVCNILVNSSEWQKRMLKNHKAELDEAEGKLSKKMEALFEDDKMSAAEQKKQMDALVLERKELTKVLVEKHTREWVSRKTS
ncbi:MAG TPA: NEL-type E3 ubiquitin ligase domain-containing protein [Rhabdochlamydiaceae bacterium]|nr:NEL-type E3 ubiquitin ligase domain-containing protein [Rhabdochlamydiaceae bacterium]